VHLSLDVVGPATPELVWQRYARPARWSEWSPQIRRVDCADEELRAGSTGRVHGPPGVAVDFTVLALDAAARTWSWQVRVLLVGVRLHLEHGVDEDELGVRTWLRLHGPAPVVLAYAPVARWALHRLVRP
jgi:hypothetical protein